MRVLVSFMLLAASVCGVSQASTECYGTVQSYFTDTVSALGSGAKVWIVMPNGLQWYVLQSDSDSRNVVANVITSITTGLPVGVRFQADGIACDSTSGVRTDVLGMWLVHQ